MEFVISLPQMNRVNFIIHFLGNNTTAGHWFLLHSISPLIIFVRFMLRLAPVVRFRMATGEINPTLKLSSKARLYLLHSECSYRLLQSLNNMQMNC